MLNYKIKVAEIADARLVPRLAGNNGKPQCFFK